LARDLEAGYGLKTFLSKLIAINHLGDFSIFRPSATKSHPKGKAEEKHKEWGH
jgi:hypothetical protein